MSMSLFDHTSWDAMLTMTKIEIELIPDPEMYVFFEKGTRGGISYIINRYSKANNKYLRSCDPKEESYYIKKNIIINVNIEINTQILYKETYYILRRKLFIWLHNV